MILKYNIISVINILIISSLSESLPILSFENYYSTISRTNKIDTTISTTHSSTSRSTLPSTSTLLSTSTHTLLLTNKSSVFNKINTTTTFITTTKTNNLTNNNQGEKEEEEKNLKIILIIIFTPSIIYLLFYNMSFKDYNCTRNIVKDSRHNLQLNYINERNNLKKKKEKEKIIHKCITVNYGYFSNKNDDICSICLNKIKIKKATLPCGHSFHKSCILKTTKIMETCPNCRRPIINNIQIID